MYGSVNQTVFKDGFSTSWHFKTLANPHYTLRYVNKQHYLHFTDEEIKAEVLSYLVRVTSLERGRIQTTGVLESSAEITSFSNQCNKYTQVLFSNFRYMK